MRSLKDHSTVRITLCEQSGVYPDPLDILISIQMYGITPLNHPLCKQDESDSIVKIQSMASDGCQPILNMATLGWDTKTKHKGI